MARITAKIYQSAQMFSNRVHEALFQQVNVFLVRHHPPDAQYQSLEWRASSVFEDLLLWQLTASTHPGGIIRNRLVYNDWGLYRFVQMLAYKCLLFGKELHIIDERDTTKMCHRCKSKQTMPLWKRTYRCENCGLVMDRDESSAVNISQRFLARLGPHT